MGIIDDLKEYNSEDDFSESEHYKEIEIVLCQVADQWLSEDGQPNSFSDAVNSALYDFLSAIYNKYIEKNTTPYLTNKIIRKLEYQISVEKDRFNRVEQERIELITDLTEIRQHIESVKSETHNTQVRYALQSIVDDTNLNQY